MEHQRCPQNTNRWRFVKRNRRAKRGRLLGREAGANVRRHSTGKRIPSPPNGTATVAGESLGGAARCEHVSHPQGMERRSPMDCAYPRPGWTMPQPVPHPTATNHRGGCAARRRHCLCESWRAGRCVRDTVTGRAPLPSTAHTRSRSPVHIKKATPPRPATPPSQSHKGTPT
jgi:hypothetical protein